MMAIIDVFQNRIVGEAATLIERGRIRARSFTWEKTAAAIRDLVFECLPG